MKKFRRVLDGLTTSSPASVGGGAATPLAPGTVSRELEVRETLVSDNFQVCKVSFFAIYESLLVLVLDTCYFPAHFHPKGAI